MLDGGGGRDAKPEAAAFSAILSRVEKQEKKPVLVFSREIGRRQPDHCGYVARKGKSNQGLREIPPKYQGRIFSQWSSTTRCGAGEASGFDGTRKVVEVLGTRCEGSYSNPKLLRTQESSKLQRSPRWRRKDAQGGDNVEEEKQREMDERKRGKKSLRLSDAQITMQIPTDRRRGRDKEEESERERDDRALLCARWREELLEAMRFTAKDHKFMGGRRER